MRNVKEQARERRIHSIIPRFSGTATFIFYLNFRGIFTADFADFTDGRPAAFYAMHFGRGNLQGADWQRLPLNEQGKGGGNGKGVIGTGMQNAPIASGRSAGL